MENTAVTYVRARSFPCVNTRWKIFVAAVSNCGPRNTGMSQQVQAVYHYSYTFRKKFAQLIPWSLKFN
jgi:hypothetical protein